jgi:hypothetical protein
MGMCVLYGLVACPVCICVAQDLLCDTKKVQQNRGRGCAFLIEMF